MRSSVSDMETHLRTLLKMAQVLKENVENCDFNQGNIMCDRYNDLLTKLVSIDPDAASFLPNLQLKGSGIMVVNLENRLREARLASGLMVAYLKEKLSLTTGIKYAKNHVSIGEIANFFGMRMGKYRVDRLFNSLGITNVPGKNKAERISYTLRETYANDKYIFERIMNSLIEYHHLSEKDFEELNHILLRIGYTIKGGKVTPTLPREIVEAEAKPFEAYLHVEEILLSATQEVKMIDPYVDQRLFPLYFHDIPSKVALKILTTKMFDKFKIVARKFKQQKNNFEVRKSTKLHDRYLIVDRRAWIIGQSIKDAGTKPLLSIIEIEDVDTVLKMFRKLWTEATKVI